METAPAIDGEVLRGARERLGLSQNDLARRIGLADGQRVSRWERGEARPRTPQSLHALAAALELEPTSLLVRPGVDGPSLRWLRFAAGVSAVEFASAARTSVSTVKRWERDGLAAPDDDTVDRLSAILKAQPGDVRRALRGVSG
ncbi:MAG: helix-turn-helix domain-containing protein [Dermatophilaceae bacterium]